MIHCTNGSFNIFFFTQNKLSYLIRLFRLITFHAAQNTVALDMSNRIIKSLDCRKIILIFCILEVDFTISVITLLVIFNKPFQKALVDKSVCVINIFHLIVLSSIKNPLFDVYFNRITALLAARFSPVMGAYLSPSALFAARFSPVMGAYLSPSALCIEIFVCYGGIFESLRTLCIDICIFHVRINISDISLFGFRSCFDNFFPFYKTKKN